jgi:HAE1 family hydrophobic/amphiphilic exporter-1
LRQALGTAVFFGMLGVTFFGLVFTPVFYITTRNLSHAMERWRERRAMAAGHHGAPVIDAAE